MLPPPRIMQASSLVRTTTSNPKKVLQVYKKMTAAAQLQFKTTMHALIVNSLTDYENALKLSLH